MTLPTPVACKERRCHKRYLSRVQRHCRLKRATEEGKWIANVQDISAEGIGLITNRPFRVGMTLTMELPTNPRRPRKPMMVRVTHARPRTGNQWWVVGGAFSRKLTKDEVDFLRNHAPSLVPGSERRTLVRHTTRLKAPCPLIRAAEEGPWLATVRNVSDQGISVIANRPFKSGMLLTVELPMKSGALGKPRLLRVRHARPHPGSQWWIVGGEFIRKLMPEEIAALV
jgi:hypothetical protein